MDTPFIFGKIASGEEFTDRENETKQLATNFQSGINTILISPRRWGKSSLVSKAAHVATKKDKTVKVCMVDLFTVRTEEQFYQTLAQEVLKSSSSKWDEIMEYTRNFLGKLIPKLSYSPEANSELSLGLDWEEVKKNPDEILDLAEKIAQSKGIRIVICIDEFQNISEFENPLAFQKRLRAHWQKHKKTSYCLYGSKRHMLMDVFTSPSMPFYKFGDILFLQKISVTDWEKFIVHRFADTGKKISIENAGLIATLAECHPYYVQQLAQQSWLRGSKTCSQATIQEALDSLLMQLSLLFQSMTDSLPTTQINFLKAIIDGSEHLSSKENLYKYKLGTSANVLRFKDAMISKEILDVENNKIVFLDPMYKLWLKKYYFKVGILP